MNGAASQSADRSRWPPPAVIVVATVLLLTHFAMAVGSKLNESTTSDELVHLTAGLSYWRNHDYRLHPENGVLPQRWAALPAACTRANFPPLQDNDAWRTSDVWQMGYQFFYASGQDHFPLLMAGRAMIALFSVATGILVFWWSRRLFGNVGGLISLTLFTFCPTFLAHGALVTSDACMAFFFLAATGAWWWHLHDPRARVWWISALTLGLAFVAKYSAVLLLPMMVVMAIIRSLAPEPIQYGQRLVTTRAGKIGWAALSAIGQGLVAAAVIWAFYGFRFSAFNPHVPAAAHFIRPWAFFEQQSGAPGQVVQALTTLHALPEGFLFGFAYVLKTVSARAAFLNGEYSVTGWPTFFPWAFLLKTTIPLLLAALVTAWIIWRRWAQTATWWRDLYRTTPLLVLFAVYWISSLASHLNIGHRHLLPTYPVIFIATGALGAWILSRQWRHIAVVIALLGWQIAESARIAPHYLAYFNAIGGGPENGWRHLVDSSLDWGQDLPSLKKWLEQHGGDEPVYLAYFGTAEPDYYGIKATRMPFLNLFRKPNPWYEPRGGIYCISATLLQHVYSPFQGDWRLGWEKEYQAGRLKEPLFREYWKNPSVQGELDRIGAGTDFVATWLRHDQLRFARLCGYLRVRPPDANAGHSILIYRLTAAEAAAATTGPLSEWRTLLERVVAKNP